MIENGRTKKRAWAVALVLVMFWIIGNQLANAPDLPYLYPDIDDLASADGLGARAAETPALGAEISIHSARIDSARHQIDESSKDSGDFGSRIPNGIDFFNQANSGQLQVLPGLGPVLAERIIFFREEHGRFSDWITLTEVRGVGQKLSKRWKEYLDQSSTAEHE